MAEAIGGTQSLIGGFTVDIQNSGKREDWIRPFLARHFCFQWRRFDDCRTHLDIPPRGFKPALAFAYIDIRVCAYPRQRWASLHSVLAETRKHGYVGIAFDAGLAPAEAELRSGKYPQRTRN